MTASIIENEYQSHRMASLAISPREVEVLQLLVDRKTSKTIARELIISAKTVEFQLENIYTKIGVRTRLMAGIWAIRQGLEAPPREIPS